MLNKRVIHKAFGEGMIIRFENDIVTVEFSARTVDFRYPDAFSKFLTLADGEEQKNVSALAAEAIQRSEEKKRAREEEKFSSKEDLMRRGKLGKSGLELLEKYGCLDGMPNSSQVSLFDSIM